mmetsp:Transcript_122541/g.273667  ORF Transcript_122541/g.273667 Transcript_122541/m.273667 type:complete len:440 (-) Transcript_122541:108-1427(-)
MDADPKLADTTSSAANIVWVVRILLPILLFWIWYQSQPSKGYGGKNRYSRDKFLAVRRALPEHGEDEDEDTKQSPLSGLRLVDEAVAQKLLGIPPPRGGGAGAGARRDAPRPKRSSGDKAVLGISEGSLAQATAGQGRKSSDGGSAEAAAAESPQGSLLTEEERMHLASLLNFVAYRHKEQPQRIFLPAEDNPPPPPPRPPQLGGEEAGVAESAKANTEAQLTLKGALNPKIEMKCSEVAKALHQQMADANIKPSEVTFSLMAKTCINAGDLRGASDFLMKMESAGYSADSSLLDKIMELYVESRASNKAGSSSATQRTAEPRVAVRNWGDEALGDQTPPQRPSLPRPSAAAAGSLSGALTTSLRPGAAASGSLSGPTASSLRPSNRLSGSSAASSGSNARDAGASAKKSLAPARSGGGDDAWPDVDEDDYGGDYGDDY